jgi:hypothetical protein
VEPPRPDDVAEIMGKSVRSRGVWIQDCDERSVFPSLAAGVPSLAVRPLAAGEAVPYRDAMAASPRAFRIVIAWNAALTLGAVGLTLAAIVPRRARFTEISAERIDIADANGTTRMVISNRDRFPDLVIEGKRGRRSATQKFPLRPEIAEQGPEQLLIALIPVQRHVRGPPSVCSIARATVLD